MQKLQSSEELVSSLNFFFFIRMSLLPYWLNCLVAQKLERQITYQYAVYLMLTSQFYDTQWLKFCLSNIYLQEIVSSVLLCAYKKYKMQTSTTLHPQSTFFFFFSSATSKLPQTLVIKVFTCSSQPINQSIDDHRFMFSQLHYDGHKLVFHIYETLSFLLQVMEKPNNKKDKFLLWKVKKPALWEHILDDMYHAALNLRLRIAYEHEQEKEVSNICKIILFLLNFLLN